MHFYWVGSGRAYLGFYKVISCYKSLENECFLNDWKKKNTRLTRNRENVVHFSIFNYHTFWVTVSLRSVFQSKRLRVDFALGFLNYELKLCDYHLRLKLERETKAQKQTRFVLFADLIQVEVVFLMIRAFLQIFELFFFVCVFNILLGSSKMVLIVEFLHAFYNRKLLPEKWL